LDYQKEKSLSFPFREKKEIIVPSERPSEELVSGLWADWKYYWANIINGGVACDTPLLGHPSQSKVAQYRRTTGKKLICGVSTNSACVTLP
jgi:hypothetical protein